jgi:aminoglycoside phosphotransferase family enzyme
LASTIAAFHHTAQKIFTPFDFQSTRNTFNDIDSICEFASEKIGSEFGPIIKRSIEWSDSFLGEHHGRIQQRIDHGLKRDVHGDLHCGNIFLYKKPVLFDCIEFNDHFRQIDVLYEISFLCMDMERYRHKQLSQAFLEEYKKHFPAFLESEDRKLFIYFKSLRANIRAKVHVMQWSQAQSGGEALQHVEEARKYLTLMNEYMGSVYSMDY